MAEVNFTVRDGIAIIEINRPEARNAINNAVAQGLADAMDQLDARDDIRVGILTGAGGSFCAGMDLKAFLKGEKVIFEGRGFAGFVEAPPKKPLIAAAEGYVLAGGFELAITCDLIVASSETKFGVPEVKRGLVAAAGGVIRLPRQIPPRIAMEMALTGEFVSAQRMEQYGLINRIVEPGKTLEAAIELAKTIAANGPMAVTTSKRLVRESEDWSTGEMFAKQDEIVAPIFTSEDAKEGATAFAEKRPPVWKGR